MTRPHGARHDAAIAPVVTVPGWWAGRGGARPRPHRQGERRPTVTNLETLTNRLRRGPAATTTTCARRWNCSSTTTAGCTGRTSPGRASTATPGRRGSTGQPPAGSPTRARSRPPRRWPSWTWRWRWGENRYGCRLWARPTPAGSPPPWPEPCGSSHDPATQSAERDGRTRHPGHPRAVGRAGAVRPGRPGRRVPRPRAASRRTS